MAVSTNPAFHASSRPLPTLLSVHSILAELSRSVGYGT